MTPANQFSGAIADRPGPFAFAVDNIGPAWLSSGSLDVTGMIRFYSNLQWIMLLAIFAVGFRHSYRAHRITRFTVLFTWALLTFHSFVFSYYGMCLGGPESNDFPDGTLIFASMVFGWFDGLIIGVIAVGSWRALHGVPLFKFLSKNEKPDA